MRLIDADELLEHVWRERLDSRERIAKLVESRPTITPERKRGKWKFMAMFLSDHVAMMCNCCGALYDKTIAGGEFNFCPHCGAVMKGE